MIVKKLIQSLWSIKRMFLPSTQWFWLFRLLMASVQLLAPLLTTLLFLLRILLFLTSLILHRYYWFLLVLSCLDYEFLATRNMTHLFVHRLDLHCLIILLLLMKITKKLSLFSSFFSFWLMFQFLPLTVKLWLYFLLFLLMKENKKLAC